MFTVVSLSLIGLSLLIMLSVILRKFPVLAILDVGRIPGEKEAKFKEQLIKAKVERDLAVVSGWFGRLWLWLARRSSSWLQAWQERLKKAKISHKAGVKVPWREKQERIKSLFSEAREDLKKAREEEAEDKLVEIISLDQKNLAAFVELGDLYFTQKKWTEARETYEYALKLSRQNQADGVEADAETTTQEICFALAGVDKEAGDLPAALENIREALEREPNSPRYLDLILDLSIMMKDKNLASENWEKLASANPENQKLSEWKEKIEKL